MSNKKKNTTLNIFLKKEQPDNYWKQHQSYQHMIQLIKSHKYYEMYQAFTKHPEIIGKYRIELMWEAVSQRNEYALLKLQPENYTKNLVSKIW